MTILVTAGAGYIGNHTLRALQRQGLRVVLLDNLVPYLPHVVEQVLQVIDTAKAVTGRGLLAYVAPRDPGDQPVLVATAECASREPGWQPRFLELSTILSNAWAWHQTLIPH